MLGLDFFRALNLEKVLDPVLGILGQKEFQIFTCSRLENFEKKVPQILSELFEENSRNLNSSQKKVFADFLSEFQDIFSGDVVVGSCKLVEHEINLNNSCAIKQTLDGFLSP